MDADGMADDRPAAIADVSLRKDAPTSWPSASSIGAKEPWLDIDGTVMWSRQRIAVCKVVDHAMFEMIMSALVMFNVVVIILETDLEALCYPEYAGNLQDCPSAGAKSSPWMKGADLALLILYTSDAIARIFVERSQCLKSPWNCLDFAIVVTGWASVVLRSTLNFAFLRFFRIARLARVMRIFLAFRELYLLIHGLITAMRAIMWGAFMMFGMLVMWAILMVELVHPVSSARVSYDECERCGRAFGSVMGSVLTLFQTIVAGDSWGRIAVPVIESDPLLAGFFIMALLTISLGLTNLILSVIVERAAEAREHDLEEKLKQKERANGAQKQQFLKMCKEMDVDRGGTLSLEELLDAYDKLPDFKAALQMLDIESDELKAVFKLLDRDGSGDVDYSEFCDQLCQIKTRDTRTMLLFIKLNLSDLREEMEAVRKAVVDRESVESAQEARDKDMQEEKANGEQKQRCLGLCLDTGRGGKMCLKQLLDAYDKQPDFKSTLQKLDIEKEELKVMFEMLDKNGSGVVAYTELLDHLCLREKGDTCAARLPMGRNCRDLKDEFDLLRKSLVDRDSDIVGLIMARMESSSVLSQHEKLLESIEERIKVLARDGNGPRGAAVSRGSGPRLPTAPPRPPDEAATSGAFGGVPPPGADSLLDDIHRLGQQTQELAGLKGVIVRRVDDHVAALTQQAGALESIGVSVKSELLALLRHVEEKFEDGAATLARNNGLSSEDDVRTHEPTRWGGHGHSVRPRLADGLCRR